MEHFKALKRKNDASLLELSGFYKLIEEEIPNRWLNSELVQSYIDANPYSRMYGLDYTDDYIEPSCSFFGVLNGLVDGQLLNHLKIVFFV